MIISNNQILSLIHQYRQQDKAYEASKDSAQKLIPEIQVDNAKITDDAKAFQIAKELIRDLPEIREDRLANVQRLVKKGTYEISDDEIAEKMLGRTLVDKLV